MTVLLILAPVKNNSNIKFHKLGIQKKIKDPGMKVIIWLVREHKAHGREITVRCKGYEVDRKRIERAMRKNPGPIPSPTCERNHF